ncbi:MAG: MMPL family transporter, partial [Proteobacteria bacterium]|nr:MMPL family transporter [Pseudomonadota bacterium]
SADAALELAARLEESPAVLDVRTAFDLVPSEQEQKLALIEDLAFVIGPDLELQEPHPLVAGDITALTRKLSRRCDAIANSASASLARAAAALVLALKRLEVAVESAGADQAPALLIALEDKLMRHFAPQLTLISEGLAASPIDIASLPEDLRRRWISDDGLFRLEILPAQNLDDNDRLAAFVDAVRAITGPAATGTPVINIEASRAVTGAFYQAFASAFILIALVLFFILRRIAEVLVVMAPLLLAGLLTTAATVWAGMSFNFANIIALPLLMGIGVDSALHILHRYKTPGPGDGPLLKTSTARAVLFSALTTTASFGNLAVSTHAGTASMGVMLTIGLTLTILCTLIVLPALLERFVKVERVAS